MIGAQRSYPEIDALIWLFGLSDGRFEQALNDFRQALRTCSDENAPQERFADAVRDQLGEAFREAVRSFPEAFAQLDRSVQHMGESAAAQSQSMIEAASGLQRGVDGLTAAAVQIAPVAELLNTATTELRSVPGQLRQTLDETREAWAQEMRRDQEAFIGTVRQVLDDQRAMLGRTEQQHTAWRESVRQVLQRWERGRREAAEQQHTAWRESVGLVQKAAAEIVATAESLPAAFTREVEQIAGGLGREFSRGAQQHVADLTQELREGNRSLVEQIDASTRELQNRLLHDTSRVVGESAEEVHRRVGEPLLSMLQNVSRGIEEALRTLPGQAETFAAGLSTADEKLQQSIERLKESADHLEKVAQLTENFQTSLTRAFRDGAARSFEPLQGQLQDVVTALRRAAARADRSEAEPPSGFFRRLYNRLRRRETGRPSDDRTFGLK